MPDITMCADGCEFKSRCYRYTATPNEFRQSYSNFGSIASKHECTYFINNEKIQHSTTTIEENINHE